MHSRGDANAAARSTCCCCVPSPQRCRDRWVGSHQGRKKEQGRINGGSRNPGPPLGAAQQEKLRWVPIEDGQSDSEYHRPSRRRGVGVCTGSSQQKRKEKS